MIKCIIFDLDGTLIHLPIRYEIIRKDLQNLFNTNNEFVPLISSIVSNAPDENTIRKAFDLICNEELVAVDNFEIFDGAINLLNQLKSNFSLNLVTLQCRKATEKIISKMSVSNLFSYVITRDESYNRINQIEKILGLLKLTANEVIMVGNRLNDISSANKVGCRSILVSKKIQQSDNRVQIVEQLSDLNEKLFKF
ncbi:MAG: HAD family hydrolase [Nitrosopumilaceae archaeon]